MDETIVNLAIVAMMFAGTALVWWLSYMTKKADEEFKREILQDER